MSRRRPTRTVDRVPSLIRAQMLVGPSPETLQAVATVTVIGRSLSVPAPLVEVDVVAFGGRIAPLRSMDADSVMRIGKAT